MPTETFIPGPAADGPNELADFVELVALDRGWRSITPSRAEAVVAEARIGVDSTILTLAMRDLRRRARWQGRVYPFVLNGETLVRSDDADPGVYRAILSASIGPHSSEVSMFFERMCEAWTKSFLGPGGCSVHFGTPSTSTRPTHFPDAIRWLAAQMGLGSGSGYRSPKRNDGGADIVAWIAFPDGEAAAVVILGQATIRRRFAHKAADIDIRLWGRWVDFVAEPIRLLYVPFAVPERDLRRSEVRDRGVVLVDRRRLCEVLDPQVARLVIGDAEIESWSSSVTTR